MQSGNTPQAFPYQGSKRKLAAVIVNCLPPTTYRLIEPFAGSAAISVAAAWTGRAKYFWLNDAHEALISLWNRIIHDPHGLSADYERCWRQQQGNERAYYNSIRREFNATHKPEYLLYLLARCVKAAIRYNRNGEFNNSPDHRRQGMHPDTMRQNLLLVSRTLGPDTLTTSTDYTAVLRETTETDVVYMDPPYQGVCLDRDSRYVKSVAYESFVDELEKLNRRHIPYIVSYDGRTGEKVYGKKLPRRLELAHTEILVGKSTQATLLGRTQETYESLYLSPALMEKLGRPPTRFSSRRAETMLFV